VALAEAEDLLFDHTRHDLSEYERANLDALLGESGLNLLHGTAALAHASERSYDALSDGSTMSGFFVGGATCSSGLVLCSLADLLGLSSSSSSSSFSRFLGLSGLSCLAGLLLALAGGLLLALFGGLLGLLSSSSLPLAVRNGSDLLDGSGELLLGAG